MIESYRIQFRDIVVAFFTALGHDSVGLQSSFGIAFASGGLRMFSIILSEETNPRSIGATWKT
jgi:hypothetical protein